MAKQDTLDEYRDCLDFQKILKLSSRLLASVKRQAPIQEDQRGVEGVHLRGRELKAVHHLLELHVFQDLEVHRISEKESNLRGMAPDDFRTAAGMERG